MSGSSKKGFRSSPSITLTPVPLASSVSRRLAHHHRHLTSDGSPSLFPRTPHPATTPRVVQENDDEKERQQRRLHKNMCTMLSPGCHTSKGTAGSARTDRSSSVVNLYSLVPRQKIFLVVTYKMHCQQQLVNDPAKKKPVSLCLHASYVCYMLLHVVSGPDMSPLPGPSAPHS